MNKHLRPRLLAASPLALLLALAERIGPRIKKLRAVSGRDGLLVGLAQVLALIPGVSRSGSTLTASLFDGWTRADAARFSFLLGIPAITIAGLVELERQVTPSDLLEAAHFDPRAGCSAAAQLECL